MARRVYLPLTASALRLARGAGAFAVGDHPAHAVTPALRAAVPDGDEDEWEYLALTAAAQASVALLRDDDPPRRLVAAVDVDSAEERPTEDDPTTVLVSGEVPWRRLAALHVDAADAEPLVAAAARGDEAAWEQCLDHEPGWYAPQELDVLLRELGAG